VEALLVRKPWIDEILDGTKTWEIRGSRTRKRGLIALVESGSGTVVGVAMLTGSVGPLLRSDLIANAKKAGFAKEDVTAMPYPKTFAWVLEGAHRLRRPVPYQHPNGAVIWVKLGQEVERSVRGG